jgi:long-subunit acyl-CoA synthetase (AMP-forming)
MIMSGGSVLSKQLSERVRTRICSNLFTAYGATETSMVAAAPAHAVADRPGAVGYVLPDISVEIVDEGGNKLPAGVEGMVRTRGAYNVSGYLGEPAGSKDAIRDDWFYPGDFGELTSENLLVIAGREKAVLKRFTTPVFPTGGHCPCGPGMRRRTWCSCTLHSHSLRSGLSHPTC